MYRQGDVLLIPVEQIPEDVRRSPKKGSRIILASGETTGHHHSLSAGPTATLLAAKGERFLRLGRTRTLTHQEHAPITVPPGTYRVVRQREYTEPKKARRVAD